MPDLKFYGYLNKNKYFYYFKKNPLKTHKYVTLPLMKNNSLFFFFYLCCFQLDTKQLCRTSSICRFSQKQKYKRLSPDHQQINLVTYEPFPFTSEKGGQSFNCHLPIAIFLSACNSYVKPLEKHQRNQISP